MPINTWQPINVWTFESQKSFLQRWDGTNFNNHVLKRWNGQQFLAHPLNRWDGQQWVSYNGV